MQPTTHQYVHSVERANAAVESEFELFYWPILNYFGQLLLGVPFLLCISFKIKYGSESSKYHP